MDFMTEVQKAQMEKILLEKRKEFEQKLQLNERHLKTITNTGQRTSITDCVPDCSALASALGKRSTKLKKCLQKFSRALEELRRGNYGICHECGNPISLERLKVQPFTEYCIRCKQEIEAEEKKKRFFQTSTAFAR
jgi:DnaK suppressor protein